MNFIFQLKVYLSFPLKMYHQNIHDTLRYPSRVCVSKDRKRIISFDTIPKGIKSMLISAVISLCR